jgi:hypothetical protein
VSFILVILEILRNKYTMLYIKKIKWVFHIFQVVLLPVKYFEYFGNSSEIRWQYHNFAETIKSYIKYDFIAYVIVMYSVSQYNNVVIDIFKGVISLIDEFENFWDRGHIVCVFFLYTNANFEGCTAKWSHTNTCIENNGGPKGFTIHNTTDS